jgi:phenylalanyl-tRNA synthetase beta subunit
MCEVVRDVAGDLAENVTLVSCIESSTFYIIINNNLWMQIDVFTNPKTNNVSKCYRINYRSMDRYC